MTKSADALAQHSDKDWVAFPGGELEGKRPKSLCSACRQAETKHLRSSPARTLCFQCYRVGLERDQALKAAGEIDTASAERFQCALPFEPVNRPRLEMLRAERIAERTRRQDGVGQFVDKRRRAQIAARHALDRIVAGLQDHERARALTSAVHAAELQLPESWMPFVVSL